VNRSYASIYLGYALGEEDKDCEGIGGAPGYLGIGWLGETRLSNS